MTPTTADRSHTRWTTLHRLIEPVDGTVDPRIFLRERYRQDSDYQIREFDNDGLSGVLAHGGTPVDRADWCSAPERLTGLPIMEPTRLTGGVVLTRTAHGLYALTYGLGHHMLDTAYRDDDFGLTFAVRALDPGAITVIRNEIMDRRGRVDEYTMARGSDIDGFGVDRFSSLVRRICGTTDLALSARTGTKCRVRVECSGSSIKLPLATSPQEFLSDLEQIEKVCAREDPLGDLTFIERIRALHKRSPAALAADAALEKLLAGDDRDRLTIGIPDSVLDEFGAAQRFRLALGRRSLDVEELDLPSLLAFVQGKPTGRRLEYLRRLEIVMYTDDNEGSALETDTHGTDWLVAEVDTADGSRYFYRQGRWHEIGAGYLATLRELLEALLAKIARVAVPAWTKTEDDDHVHDEGWFNREVAKKPGYQLFDKKTVVTAKYRGGGLEICDVLGPDGELICVKKAASTAALNHLFAQAVVAVTTLRLDKEVRTRFLDQVRLNTPDHPMLSDMGTLKVVFAILLKDGIDITVDSLFAFAQISLVKALRELTACNADVTVLPIRRS
ncbi:DUF6119 family protein [Nocardia macrotermitis]|uniref:Sporadically distributed protein, TIGR04141 family n=1 Tax=Nocardia macrotermitis TaxID=2585198 RepID=A0A7K0D3C1_9NOCA|nr:DUF6119 family protein [Nocardia macrotermitis]MQY20230.1 hypothetical protein [Nocardia macrotermitis]